VPQGADLYIPIFVYLPITALATVVTERRKNVRAYFWRGHVFFEPADARL
jgi:hypothetical protein